jgi:glycerol-3-phosphate dehydrogenase
VLALAEADRGLAAPILAGQPDLLAEAALAARREQAQTVGDVLLRRTRLGVLAARDLLGGDAAERVAAVLAGQLGWDATRAAAEAAAFRAEAAAEGLVVTG